MSTRIEIEYDRQFEPAEVQAIIARAAATLNVLQQLGAPYQNLPGYAMAAYQAEADALETEQTNLNALLDQVRPLLIAMDAKSRPLDEKNKGIYRALDGLLKTDADRALLPQITGPTPQGGSPPPPPPPPNP
jgi:L-rhamnose isomerase